MWYIYEEQAVNLSNVLRIYIDKKCIIFVSCQYKDGWNAISYPDEKTCRKQFKKILLMIE